QRSYAMPRSAAIALTDGPDPAERQVHLATKRRSYQFWYRFAVKPLEWVGSAREDLRAFPEQVRRRIGVALREAQLGGMSRSAKPLRGFGGASVLEVVADHDGDTYRTAYTVRFERAVYVLHAFQKK